MSLGLTDPSHQGRQDLEVLGLLDVEEGEGPQEESEDGLGDKHESERGAEARPPAAHPGCGEDTPSTRPGLGLALGQTAAPMSFQCPGLWSLYDPHSATRHTGTARRVPGDVPGTSPVHFSKH